MGFAKAQRRRILAGEMADGLIQDIDLLLRGAAIGVTALAVLRPLAAGGHRRKSVAIAALGVTVCGYLLISAPSAATLAAPVVPVLILLAILAPLAFTWSVLEIFHDNPLEGWPWLGLAVCTVVAAGLGLSVDGAGVVRAALAGVLYVGILWIAIRSGPDDLVEARRKFRRAFVVAMVALGLAITAVEATVAFGWLPGGVLE